MTAKVSRAFLVIAIFQALHSLEEYVFELWEYLAPTRFLIKLFSDDLPFGFAVANLTIVALIFLSYLIPVRRAKPYASQVVWFWAVLEILNGAGHLWFGISSGAYFPGIYTAPFLLLFGTYLLVQLTANKNVT